MKADKTNRNPRKIFKNGALGASNSQDPAQDPTQKISEGNHTETLKTKATRAKAAAEQSKLQNDPNALPAVGYPTNLEGSSPAANPQDVKQHLDRTK